LSLALLSLAEAKNIDTLMLTLLTGGLIMWPNDLAKLIVDSFAIVEPVNQAVVVVCVLAAYGFAVLAVSSVIAVAVANRK
jgi:hypothetical protein